MRVAYLGPAGTFSHEALMLAPGAEALDLVPLPTLHAAVLAVHDGAVDRALVPIENSREGSVNPTLDALAFETDDVVIVGERLHPVHHCLLAPSPVELAGIRTVVSHPQASAQCARFLREALPDAVVVAADSTADAVRRVAAERDAAAAALGTRLAARLYGCAVLREDVEDDPGNETRFVWLAPAAARAARPLDDARAAAPHKRPLDEAREWKTALVFWGAGSAGPGWLVRCLSEFASRGVNLTRIESRPLRQGLGEYMFFVDLAGSEADAAVADAIAGLRGHAEVVRVLGSFPAA
jgi:prephenate dehydratase